MAPDNSFFGAIPPPDADLDTDCVHRIRKETKRLRAQLDLLRSLNGRTPAFKALRLQLRKLARLLAQQRDADVMQMALQQMQTECEEPEARQMLIELNASMQTSRLSETDKGCVHALIKSIEQDAPRVIVFSHEETAIRLLLQARLNTLCIKGEELLQSTDFVLLHDWRKQVKRLLFQYQTLSSLSNRDKSIIEHLEQLGSSLGKINDMCMLDTFIRNYSASSLKAKIRNSLQNQIENKQNTELQKCKSLFEAICELRQALRSISSGQGLTRNKARTE